MTMRLRIRLPSRIFLDESVKKVTAEAENGEFCLLPNHVDFVTALASGILSYEDENEKDFYVAVDEGTLVKIGSDVWVSTRNAVRNVPLGKLEQTVAETFSVLNEQEKKARAVISKIEAGIIRRFLDTQKM